MTLRSCTLVLAICLLVASEAASAATWRDGQVVMGTVIEVSVSATDQERAKEIAREIVATARRWDDVLTTWRPEGELQQFNDKAGQGWVEVSADLADALRQMVDLWTATDGAFDPSVASLVQRWQGGTTPVEKAGARKPLTELLAIRGREARLAKGETLIAGAIGKGIALEAIEKRIKGLRQAEPGLAVFVNFGGSSQLAVGQPVDEPHGWKVLLPGVSDDAVGGLLWLRDNKVTTSTSGGPGYEGGPIIDPRSGEPVPAGRTATVLGAADGWSTALVVLGCDGLGLAAKAGLEARIHDSQRNCATPGFPVQP